MELKPMTQSWKTVRVFISSTFRDMQAERDHLVGFVFPKLREELAQYRIHLDDIDLRWGVMSDQDITDVCREIIDQCRPRFICLLGVGIDSSLMDYSPRSQQMKSIMLPLTALVRGNTVFSIFAIHRQQDVWLNMRLGNTVSHRALIARRN